MQGGRTLKSRSVNGVRRNGAWWCGVQILDLPSRGGPSLLDLKHTCKGTELGYFMTPFFFFWMLNVCIALTYELLKKTTVKICAFKGRPPS